jgi:plasmid stability protein
MNKNITMTIDETVLKKVRIFAAERRTSVNALVREYLDSLVAKERATDEARESLLNLAREKAGDMGSQKWNREKLYDR